MVKFFAIVVLLLSGVGISLGVRYMMPISKAAPDYPAHLADLGYTGKVRVFLTVAPDGSVHKTRIIESSHPDMSTAVQVAAARWRLPAWDLPQTDVEVLVIFGAQGHEPFSDRVTVGLSNTLCAYLNYEVAASKRDYPGESLSKVDIFRYTAQFLNSEYVALKVPDQKLREKLTRQFNKSILQIVARCRNNPNSRYATHLPQGVKEVLGSIRPVSASGKGFQ